MTGAKLTISTHVITDRSSPIDITATCTCGWSHRESRRQNARARAAKLEAAVRRHWREVEPDGPQEETT